MDPGLDDLVCRILREGAGRPLRIRKTSLYHSGQPVNKRARKYASIGKDIIRNFDASQKVWVGGLTDAVTWQALQEIVDTVGKSKWVEILGKGQACVCYGTAEEAKTAIATLKFTSLQFDVWTKQEK
jgi:RNA recognition motif-containing protein